MTLALTALWIGVVVVARTMFGVDPDVLLAVTILVLATTVAINSKE